MADELTAASIADLVEVLGARTVTLIGALDRTSRLRRWINQGAIPDEAAWRLTYALRAVRILLQRFGAQTVRAWFWGANHDLADETPVAALARGTLDQCKQVLVAAGSFASV